MIFAVKSQAKTVAIEILKHHDKNYIHINYKFSSPVKSISFSNTPAEFINGYWDINQNNQSINIVNNTIQLSSPVQQLSIKMKEGFDTSELRAYSPFLAFADNYAIFTSYFLPSDFSYIDSAKKHEKSDLTYNLKAEYYLKDKKYALDRQFYTSDNLSNYLLINDIESNIHDSISIIIDHRLPLEMNNLITSFTTDILNYYGDKFGKKYPRPIDVLVTYDKSKEYLSFEGAALDGQLILGLSGKDISDEPMKYKTEVLVTLAHEAVHLWNAFIWPNNQSAPSWLYEGAADYLAYEALLSLKLMPQSHFDFYLANQKNECETVLNEKALNRVDNTQYFYAAYSCGRIIFDVVSDKFNEHDRFDFWKNFVKSSPESGYSINEFQKLVNGNARTMELLDDLQKVLSSDKLALNSFRQLTVSNASGTFQK